MQHQDGYFCLSLNEVTERLADEGNLSKTGEPHSTSTINKVVKRARKRREMT